MRANLHPKVSAQIPKMTSLRAQEEKYRQLVKEAQEQQKRMRQQLNKAQECSKTLLYFIFSVLRKSFKI
jgi:hypothetical protein